MLYTIGNIDSYTRYAAQAKRDGLPFQKAGNTDNYEGGTVWQTYEEADSYLKKSGLRKVFRVYGVEADWEDDAVDSKGCTGSRSLIRNANLVEVPDVITVTVVGGVVQEVDIPPRLNAEVHVHDYDIDDDSIPTKDENGHNYALGEWEPADN